MLTAATRMYDIREDVRIYIMCDIIIKVWSREKPDDLQKSRREEIADLEKKKTNTLKFTKKIEEVRANGQDITNFVPHLQDYEEQKLLKEKMFQNMELNMTPLKTPHVFNNLKYKNENRFSSLYNSENC